jgi:hypothetical protein
MTDIGASEREINGLYTGGKCWNPNCAMPDRKQGEGACPTCAARRTCWISNTNRFIHYLETTTELKSLPKVSQTTVQTKLCFFAKHHSTWFRPLYRHQEVSLRPFARLFGVKWLSAREKSFHHAKKKQRTRTGRVQPQKEEQEEEEQAQGEQVELAGEEQEVEPQAQEDEQVEPQAQEEEQVEPQAQTV